MSEPWSLGLVGRWQRRRMRGYQAPRRHTYAPSKVSEKRTQTAPRTNIVVLLTDNRHTRCALLVSSFWYDRMRVTEVAATATAVYCGGGRSLCAVYRSNATRWRRWRRSCLGTRETKMVGDRLRWTSSAEQRIHGITGTTDTTGATIIA